ncbi:hypothetical protein [Streptomyces eurythermus]|uniref:hypothetical protein n=1 Tax=Streptomyces eurythermus TaxID=42237 RepID=UPI00340DE180
MRVLPARRLASTVLCAAVLAGITGPVALAADAAGEHGRTASRASVPAAEKERLLAQVRSLGRTHPELSPVADLLSRSLEAGRLPADEARRLGEAAKEAVIRAAAPPAAPVTARHAHVGAPVARDALGDALGALVSAIENLVKAVTGAVDTGQTATTDEAATTGEAATTDDPDQQLPSLDGLLSGLLDLLTGLFGGGSGLTVTELPTPAGTAAATPDGTTAATPDGTTAATPASVPGPAPAG